MIALIPFSCLISASMGAFPIEPQEALNIFLSKVGWASSNSFTSGQENVLVYIRLPRVLLGMLVGAALAVSGAGMQGLFRNPLADPGLIGISAGAVLAAAIAIVLGWNLSNSVLGIYGLSAATFIGATASALLVFKLASTNGKTQVSTMLLAGIAINALAGAVTGFIIYTADDDELRSITFWTLGSLGGANWKMVLSLTPLVIVPLIMIPRLSRQLDAYSLGESEAHCLGVNTQRLKYIMIIWVTLAVGASVAMVGMIGFIGLVVPHISRMIFGVAHRYVILGSALAGAIVLSLSDMLCRTIVSPAELPIGIITAMMGTPLFLSILIRQKKKTFGYV